MPVYEDIKFEPIAKVGENIILVPLESYSLDKAGRPRYFKVTHIEPLPAIYHDFGSISASSEVTDKEISNLYLHDNQLGQYRIYPLDDIVIKVKQPKSSKRYATKNYVSSIDAFTYPDNLREIFIFEDENATYFDVSNPNNYAISKARAKFVGWKFILEPIVVTSAEDIPKTYTVVPLETTRSEPLDPISWFKTKVGVR